MSDSTEPAPKTVTITFEWYIHQYKVRSVTNTTAFKPGDWKTPEEVERMCARPNFHVIIVDNDLIGVVTGVAIGAATKAATVV